MAEAADADAWQQGFAKRATDPERWLRRTAQLTELARLSRSADLSGKVNDFIHWIRFTADHPELVQPQQLSELVGAFSRLATNLGRGDQSLADGIAALDQAIALQRDAGGPVVDLYLAKATFLRAEYNESDVRVEALRSAIAAADEGTEAWARAMIARCTYEVEISRYAQAIRTAGELRRAMAAGPQIARYDCAALTNEGIALFTSFQDLDLASKRLTAACAYEAQLVDDAEALLWIAMAYHYQARIAEVRRRYRTSLLLYLKSQSIADRLREDVIADSFAHLRIAEPLVAAGQFDHARDHIDRAYTLSRTCQNQGSLRLQIDLGFATLEAASGNPSVSITIVREARGRARAMGFWRGELLCDGYLLSLAIRQRALWRIPALMMQILRSLFVGELRRNNLARLLIRIPTVLAVALRRMSRGQTRKVASDEAIIACPCPLHDAPTGQHEGSARPVPWPVRLS